MYILIGLFISAYAVLVVLSNYKEIAEVVNDIGIAYTAAIMAFVSILIAAAWPLYLAYLLIKYAIKNDPDITKAVKNLKDADI